jgi:hypothetical protein
MRAICRAHLILLNFITIIIFSEQHEPWRRSEWSRGLRRGSTAPRFLGFPVRIPPGHAYLCLINVVCCQVELSVTERRLFQRSPTEFGVSECDQRGLDPIELSSYHETLVMQFPASCTSSLLKMFLFTLVRKRGGTRRTVPLILNLSSRWRWVVNFAPRPLYSCGRSGWASEPGWTVLEKIISFPYLLGPNVSWLCCWDEIQTGVTCCQV